MKRGGPTHPKVLDLSRRLGVSRSHAVGLLECLWHFTAVYARTGAIGAHPNEAIAEALAWPMEDAKRLIDALVQSRFLDVNKRFGLIVHDWSEHVDDYVHAQVARAFEFFCDGKIPNFRQLHSTERDSVKAFYENAKKPQQKHKKHTVEIPQHVCGADVEIPQHVCGNSTTRLRSHTIPYHTIPSPPPPSVLGDPKPTPSPRSSDEGVAGGVVVASKTGNSGSNGHTRKPVAKPAARPAVKEEPEPWL